MRTRTLGLLLVIPGLLILGASFGASSQELGEPPIWPEYWPGPEAQPRGDEGKAQEFLAPGLAAVNPQSREDSRAFFNTHYLATDSPIDWTGNRSTCDAGATASSFRDAVQLRLNYFRAMAGVPANITFAAPYIGKNQAAALMMSVNGQLNHFPPVNWTCYTADGAQAAGNSNLALGAYGREAIDLYMKDPGGGNGFVGHRRWILLPPTQTMGTGDIPSGGGWAAQALWVIDATSWGPRPATREEYVAWPPPGFVPYQVVYPRWSFSYPGAVFTSATVTMTQGGAGVPVILEPVATGYGDNTLVWIPLGMNNGDAWPKPSSDSTYAVAINNVMISGIPRSFTYNVTVFDPATVPTPTNPTIALNVNQSSFHSTQQLRLDTTVTPGSPSVNADIYVALQLPNGSLLFFLGGNTLTPSLQPIVSNWTIGSFSGQIFTYTFSGAEPAGSYSWLAGFTQPGTLNFIGPIVSAPFSFAP